MSAAKKPVATVKANFSTKAAVPANAAVSAEDAEKAVVKEEKKVEKKVEKKAAPAAKAAEKKEAPVKKAAVPAAKAAEKKEAPAKKAEEKAAAPAPRMAEIILQWNGNDYTYDRLLQSAKDVWQYDQGKNVADFKTAQIYVKPENSKAYVVVNGTDELSFDI